MKSISLKKNVIANYFGQFYLISIGVVVTPLYHQYLGAEAYGLVGFFTLLQTWLNLLDVGLTPTLGRQVAYARGKKNGFDEFKSLLKSFELIFFILAVIAFGIVFTFAEWISTNWLKAEYLTVEMIAYCIALMGVMVGLRWFVGLYRSGLNGLEDQVWLNIASILMATLKFLGALALLILISTDIEHFFEYQLVLAVLELLIYSARFYKKIPPSKHAVPMVSFNWLSLKSIAPFALGIAYTSGLWVFVAQVDKLVLSGVLTLEEFGYFSLMIVISGAIKLMTAPVSQTVQPRMTYLLSNDKVTEMLSLYRVATQSITLIAMSVALVVAFFAEPLMYAWTGNVIASQWAEEVLFWYALGNGLLAISALQYYLQVAHGKLKLHIQGSTLSAIVDTPIMIYVALSYGAIGAGVAWLLLRAIWFLFWVPIVHRKFAPGINTKWMVNDVLLIVFPMFFCVFFLKGVINLDTTMDRFDIFLYLFFIGLSTLFTGAVSSSYLRFKFKCAIKYYLS